MLQVAIDAGPLHGRRTGIGNAVAWSTAALMRLERADRPRLLPYVTSIRAKLELTESWPERRLPVPAALALRIWARSDRPELDRLLGSPDLVYGTNYVVPPTRCPRLVAVYDCWFLEHPADAHPDVQLAAAVLRRAAANGANVVCSSQATADRARHVLDTDRVYMIHLGLPPAHVAQEVPSAKSAMSAASIPFELDSEPFVLALGTIERRKNLPILITAFARLANDVAGVRLVIAGNDGDDSAAVARAIDALPSGTRARVVVLGSVDELTKRELLQHARVLAYPSLDEGFGFPILEAQLAGTPVVASSVGSIPEIAGHGALLSLPNDSEALAANLHRALTSDDTRRRLITSGTENVQRFSWEANANAHVDLYHRLVGGQ
jgi:glycosyltransferase involved in cell wall biosynthesis